MTYATTGLFVLISFVVFAATILIYDLVVLLRGGVTLSQYFNWLGKTSPVVPLIIGLGFGLPMGHFFWPIYQTQAIAQHKIFEWDLPPNPGECESDEPPLAGAERPNDDGPELYPHIPISKAATWTRPRAEIDGVVSLVKHEEDGDWHFRVDDLRDPSKFVVCECIPELPLSNNHPRLHDHVQVKGIVRFDKQHSWAEIHPVVSWRMAK